MATTPKNRPVPGLGQRQRSRISRRYRGSKICSGSTTPGNRGVPSGNNGISSPIPAAYGPQQAVPSRLAAGRPRWLPWRCPRAPPRRWPVLARIDLRGSALPGPRELAGLLPRAGTDIDSVMATVRPLCEDVRIRGAQAVREITARLDGVDAEDFAVPQDGARPGARRVRPGAAGRARGGDHPGPDGARRPAAHRRHHPGRPRRHGDRALAAGAPASGSTCPAGWRRCCPASS